MTSSTSDVNNSNPNSNMSSASSASPPVQMSPNGLNEPDGINVSNDCDLSRSPPNNTVGQQFSPSSVQQRPQCPETMSPSAVELKKINSFVNGQGLQYSSDHHHQWNLENGTQFTNPVINRKSFNIEALLAKNQSAEKNQTSSSPDSIKFNSSDDGYNEDRRDFTPSPDDHHSR